MSKRKKSVARKAAAVVKIAAALTFALGVATVLAECSRYV